MRFNNYDIKTDQLNWILSEVRTIKDKESKNCGKERLTIIGYYSTFEKLIEKLREQALKEVWNMSANTKEVTEMLVMELEDISKIKRECK